MTPEEQNLDMLVAELDRENRLLRARNERLEKEAEQRKPWVGLTDDDIRPLCKESWAVDTVKQWAAIIEAKLREKNT
jgi:hypothetical protein